MAEGLVCESTPSDLCGAAWNANCNILMAVVFNAAIGCNFDAYFRFGMLLVNPRAESIVSKCVCSRARVCTILQ